MEFVRKARELVNIKELNLSYDAERYYTRNDSTTLQVLVLKGRIAHFKLRFFGKDAHVYHYDAELAKAVEEAGFIRHDLNKDSFIIGSVTRYFERFYRENYAAKTPGGVEDLTNSQYECWQNPTEANIKILRFAFKDVLDPYEYSFVSWFLDLDSMQDYTKQWMFEKMNSIQIEGQMKKIYETLCDKKALPKSTSWSSRPGRIEIENECYPLKYNCLCNVSAVEDSINQLEDLFETYPFDQARKLISSIRNLREISTEHEEEAQRYLARYEEIGRLFLKRETYDKLWQYGIHTIGDIINLSQSQWSEVPGINMNFMKEIQDKMHKAGYEFFEF